MIGVEMEDMLHCSKCCIPMSVLTGQVRGHPFMTSTQRGIRLMWMGRPRGKLHVDIHTES